MGASHPLPALRDLWGVRLPCLPSNCSVIVRTGAVKAREYRDFGRTAQQPSATSLLKWLPTVSLRDDHQPAGSEQVRSGHRLVLAYRADTSLSSSRAHGNHPEAHSPSCMWKIGTDTKDREHRQKHVLAQALGYSRGERRPAVTQANGICALSTSRQRRAGHMSTPTRAREGGFAAVGNAANKDHELDSKRRNRGPLSKRPNNKR